MPPAAKKTTAASAAKTEEPAWEDVVDGRLKALEEALNGKVAELEAKVEELGKAGLAKAQEVVTEVVPEVHEKVNWLEGELAKLKSRIGHLI
jgi:hypothetical protein